jgi:FKBP-type peptidyl-prolyl cis-trans isomerase FkpA
MRGLLILLPAVVLAQTPAPKAPVRTKPAQGPSTAKPPGTPKPATEPAPATMTDEQKTIYAIGVSIYKSLGQFDLSPNEVQLIEKAITDSASNKAAVDLNEWGPKIQALAGARMGRVRDRQKAESQAYLTKAATEAGAVKTESGLVYRELTPGTGASPKATDTVKVNYRGTLTDGTEFDSSYKRNEPAQFPLTNVIRCWTEGLQKMKVGGKSVLVCPSDIAYGDTGRPSIPPGAALMFEIELLDIVSGAR